MKNEDIRERFVKLGRKRLDDVVLAHILNETDKITDLNDCIDIFCLLHMEYSDDLSYFEMCVLTYMIAEYDNLLTSDERFTLWSVVPCQIMKMLEHDTCWLDESCEFTNDYDYDDGKYSIYDVYSPSELGVHVTYR